MISPSEMYSSGGREPPSLMKFGQAHSSIFQMKRRSEACKFLSKRRLHQHSPHLDYVTLSSGWDFVRSFIWPSHNNGPFVCRSPYVKIIDHGLVLQTIFGPIIYSLSARR